MNAGRLFHRMDFDELAFDGEGVQANTMINRGELHEQFVFPALLPFAPDRNDADVAGHFHEAFLVLTGFDLLPMNGSFHRGDHSGFPVDGLRDRSFRFKNIPLPVAVALELLLGETTPFSGGGILDVRPFGNQTLISFLSILVAVPIRFMDFSFVRLLHHGNHHAPYGWEPGRFS
jgi:hypothetical protein